MCFELLSSHSALEHWLLIIVYDPMCCTPLLHLHSANILCQYGHVFLCFLVLSTMPALAGGSLPVLGSLKLKISNVKNVQPSFLAVYASTVKIVISNPGFGVTDRVRLYFGDSRRCRSFGICQGISSLQPHLIYQY